MRQAPPSTVHHVQLALVVAKVGVGLGEEVLQDLLGGLVPKLPLTHGSLAITGLLLAEPLMLQRQAILGGLLTPLVGTLRELLDLVAL